MTRRFQQIAAEFADILERGAVPTRTTSSQKPLRGEFFGKATDPPATSMHPVATTPPTL